MRNVSDKSWRQNQNTHSMFNNFFLKIVQFMRCGKILQSQTGHRLTLRVACALHTGYLRLQTHAHK